MGETDASNSICSSGFIDVASNITKIEQRLEQALSVDRELLMNYTKLMMTLDHSSGACCIKIASVFEKSKRAAMTC